MTVVHVRFCRVGFSPPRAPPLRSSTGVVIRIRFLEALDDARRRLGAQLAHHHDGDAGEDEARDDVQARR